MKFKKTIIIALFLLCVLMIGAVSAGNPNINNHPLTPTINGLSVSDQNNININLQNTKNKQIHSTISINGITTNVDSSSISVGVSIPTDTALITISNGIFSANINKVNAATGNSFHVNINNHDKTFFVILKDSKGNFIKNQQVTVTINGNTIITNTDGNGQITVAVSTNANSANISYSGTVKKTSTNVKLASKITAPTKTFKTKIKTKKYTVTLKSGKTLIKNAKITLKIKGKTYTVRTNNKGKATFKITNLKKKGKYSATITFKGTSKYKASKKTVKIRIK